MGAAVAGRPAEGHMTPGWSQTGVPAGTEEGGRTVQSLFSEEEVDGKYQRVLFGCHIGSSSTRQKEWLGSQQLGLRPGL